MSLKWYLFHDFLMVARKLEKLGFIFDRGGVIIVDVCDE